MKGGLPKDIIVYVLPQLLSPIDLTRLRSTCKQYYEWFRNDQEIKRWRIFVEAYTLSRCIYEAALSGHRDLVDLFIAKGADYWDQGLRGASSGGHRELVDFFISKGASDWRDGLWGASLGGHRELVEFFISKGADTWDWGLEAAFRGGHRDLVDFFRARINQRSIDWRGH